ASPTSVWTSGTAPTPFRAPSRCWCDWAAASERAMRRVLACACLLLTASSAAPRAGAGLEVEVKSLRAPSTAVVATLELRDVLPERFKKTIDEGGVLHLRVQTEVWEARRVWDRLVYRAMVRVLRFG